MFKVPTYDLVLLTIARLDYIDTAHEVFLYISILFVVKTRKSFRILIKIQDLHCFACARNDVLDSFDVILDGPCVRLMGICTLIASKNILGSIKLKPTPSIFTPSAILIAVIR